jgi:hypothetical protein
MKDQDESQNHPRFYSFIMKSANTLHILQKYGTREIIAAQGNKHIDN